MLDDSSTLFVYGLLRSDMSAGLQSFVPGKARQISRASVVGTLYDLSDYPGLVLSDDGETVVGEVWEITDVSAWEKLDAFEDIRADGTGMYRREAIAVMLADGREVLAQAYLYNRDVTRLRAVSSGDWSKR